MSLILRSTLLLLLPQITQTIVPTRNSLPLMTWMKIPLFPILALQRMILVREIIQTIKKTLLPILMKFSLLILTKIPLLISMKIPLLLIPTRILFLLSPMRTTPTSLWRI